MFFHSVCFVYPQIEQYKFRHLTTEDGLPSNYTWSIMQDSRGFMWFTTRAGLCRYDGYNVKVFGYDPDDTTSMSDIYAKSTITEDTCGFIWVGTINGLNKFDPITEKFTRYIHNRADLHSISSNWMRCTYLDRQGVVWIGTEGHGLNRYNAATDNFDSFLPSPDFSVSSGIRGIYEDSSGILWIGTGNGLYQFDRNTENFLEIGLVLPKESRIANRFTTITEDIEGNIWYCADRIYKYNKSTKKLSPFTGFSVESAGSSNPTYMNILLDQFDNNKTLWIARSSLYKYDLSAGKLITIFNDPSDQENFVGRNPRALFMDPSGLLWIATTTGITVLDTRTGEIQSHPTFTKKFQMDALSFLKDSKEHFWIGGNNGLIHYDEKMKLVHWYKPMKNNENETSFKGVVKKILEDSENNIWIICHKDGVYLLDHETNEFLRCKLLRYGKDVRQDNLYDIYEDTQGTIWVGGYGLFKRIKGSPQLTTLYLDTSNRSTRNYTHTRITEDQTGNLWISSIAGVLLRQPASYRGTDTFFEYRHNPDESNSLSNSHIWSVYVDDSGEVWVGTNHGLNRFVKEKDCFERYLMDTESGAGFIYDIVKDRKGYLWMTTEKGLIGYDPSTRDKSTNAKNQIKQYLPFDQIFRTQLYKDQSGIIYFGSASGTGNGYYSFHPEDISQNRIIPPIVITSFKIRNESVEMDSSITTKKNLSLNWDQNFFSFEFAALDYTKPDQNQYAYMLDGLDENWIYSKNRRTVNYTNVSPGTYTFKVKGSNSDGYWNEVGTSISITIIPPPWKTWWAYSLYVLFSISLIVIVLRFYLRRQRLLHNLELEQIQTEKLEELDSMKSRFFANISHEFRTPLTLILGPVEKHMPTVKGSALKQDLSVIQRNALRLQRLINQILNLSKIETGKMKLRARVENIVALVNGYVQSFESLAKQKEIDFKFNSAEEDIQLFVDKDKIEKILYNLLSNAFKFTDKGGRIEIIVTLLEEGRAVSISISDTGKGIPPDKLEHIFDRFYQVDDSYTRDQEGTGIGLALTKELVKLHHGEIKVESHPDSYQEGKGTTIRVYLPTGKEHLSPDEIADEIISEEQNVSIQDQHDELTYKREKILIKASDSEKSKPILLVVEDNVDLLFYIREYLEKFYNILGAVDGEEGLQEAIKHIPDLIISDVMMPGMDGFELCRKLKSDERTSHIPVILLTARAGKESKIEGLETGADDFITKPFDNEELLTRVKNLIEQRNRIREQFFRNAKRIGLTQLMGLPASGITSMDQKFLGKAVEVVEEHMGDFDFSVDRFSQEMSVSNMQLYRKLKALVNLSANEFIRSVRLNHAAQLIKQKNDNIAQISYAVGFNNPSYFAECFKKQFGVSPSEYSREK